MNLNEFVDKRLEVIIGILAVLSSIFLVYVFDFILELNFVRDTILILVFTAFDSLTTYYNNKKGFPERNRIAEKFFKTFGNKIGSLLLFLVTFLIVVMIFFGIFAFFSQSGFTEIYFSLFYGYLFLKFYASIWNVIGDIL